MFICNWHIYDNVFNLDQNKTFEDHSDFIKNTINFLKINAPFAKVSSLTNLHHVYMRVTLNTLYVYRYKID